MDPFEFTVSSEQHGEIANLVGNLDAVMRALCDYLSDLFNVLGAAADASAPAQDADQGVPDFGGGEDAAV